MFTWFQPPRKSTRRSFLTVVPLALFGSILGLRCAPAQTYVSAEPIPSVDVVGETNLNTIVGIGYQNLELWGQRVLNECRVVQNVINVLSDHGSIRTVTPGNSRYVVAAGGFEGVTNPSFVMTFENSGPAAASPRDIYVLNNALGYVLSQSGTAQFSLPYDKKNGLEFALDFAVVTFKSSLTGRRAGEFFDYLGTIDPDLWTGTNAGFTQVSFGDSAVNNYMLNDSMLFLIGSVSKHQFASGLYRAATTYPDAVYFPLAKNGTPTTGTAGAAFPGNDWIAFPGGDEYLANIAGLSPDLLKDLSALRRKHLEAVNDLVRAVNGGKLDAYLGHGFRCPR
jgi:hypothetical protein